MSHVLVTGSTGYLGSALIPLLANSAHISRITTVHRTSNPPVPLAATAASPKLRCMELGDWLGESVNPALADVDYICHLAAARDSSNGGALAESMALTQAIIQQAAKRGVKGIINISSQAVYGTSPPQWRESDPAAPATPYGMSKYASELLCGTVSTMSPPLRTISLRLPKLVGPSSIFRLNQGEVPHLMVDCALKGKELQIQNNGTQRLDLMDVRDAGQVIVRLLGINPQQWPSILNIGSGWQPSTLELAALVSEISQQVYGRPLKFKVLPGNGNIRHFGMCTDLLHEVLGELNFTPRKTTLVDICAWIAAQDKTPRQ